MVPEVYGEKTWAWGVSSVRERDCTPESVIAVLCVSPALCPVPGTASFPQLPLFYYEVVTCVCVRVYVCVACHGAGTPRVV